MLSNIPKELKALPQWVCFDLVDGKKIPYVPGSSNMAASNRPRDWRSFRAACEDVESGKRQHIGFAFSSADPYVFIDLDDPEDKEQRMVFERIETYAQLSVSGNGCHLICKGTFAGAGKHPKVPHAGLFKEDRFCLMTGDIAGGRKKIKEVPEADLQAIHTWLGGNRSNNEKVDLVEYASDIPNQTVLEMGLERFTKFDSLCRGDWEKYEEFHGDHSTADHAFIAMLCDLTESNEQVRWFFGNSGMWTEERAAKKAGHGFENYVNRTIAKIRGNQARMEKQFAKVTLRFNEEPQEVHTEATVSTGAKHTGKRDLIDKIPAGLIRDMAEYSFSTAYLPLQEASLVTALSMASAICSRGYVGPSSTGLNLWMVVVGKTGCGKDELQSGFKRLLSGIAKTIPHFRRVFGGEIVSGAGVETVFQETLRYMAFYKEFGKTYSTWASAHQQEHTKNLAGALLNSYNASHIGGSIEGRKKARNEGEKPFVERPCLSIMGDATPGELYDSIATRELASGFLQRFMLFNVKRSSWSARANPKAGTPAPKALIARLTQLVESMERFDATQNAKPRVVQGTPEAINALNEYCFKKRMHNMNSPEERPEDEVYNRAGLKVTRLCTLAAVCADPHSPLIEMEHVQWAIDLVDSLDGDMLKKFSSGEVGSSQVKQEAVIRKAAEAVMLWPRKQRLGLGMSEKVADIPALMPLAQVKDACVNHTAFAGDRLGAVTAFEKCVDSMVKSGVFSRLEANYALENFDHVNGVLLCYKGKE